MAEGIHVITKIAIMICSTIIGFLVGVGIFRFITDHEGDLDSQKNIIQMVLLGGALLLCVLAFMGAYFENPTLCWISLGFAIVIFGTYCYYLVMCLTEKDSCESDDYFTIGITMAIVAVIIIAIFAFISSISR